MAKLLRQRLPYNSNIYTTGTWSDVAGTSSIPGHKSKADADTTSTVTVEFALPAEYDQFGARLLAVHIPIFVGTANLDAVITGNLYRNNLYKAVAVPAQTFTANADTNVITLATGQLRTGQPVTVSSGTTLPGGLAASTTYYWGNAVTSGTTYTGQLFTTQAAAFSGSSPIDLTSAGTGTHTMTCEAVDVTTIPATFSGTQVTSSANTRRLICTVDSPAYENTNMLNLADLFTYTMNFSINAAATSVIRVHDGFALWDSNVR